MKKITSRGLLVILIGLLLTFTDSIAGTRLIDRLEIEASATESRINIYFDVPIRHISHIANQANTEISIQLKLTSTPDDNADPSFEKEVLSWNPTADIPLDKIEFQAAQIGTSSLNLRFATSVDNYEIVQDRDFFVLTVVLKKKRVVKNVIIEQPTPLADPKKERPKSTQLPTKKALPAITPQPVLKGKYVINLMSQRRPVDFEKIAPIPIPKGKQIYTTETKIEGKVWYRLRIGFYRKLTQAQQDLESIQNFYSQSWIAVASTKEQKQVTTTPDALPKTSPGKPVMLPKRDTKDQASQPLISKSTVPPSDRVSLMMTKAREVMTAGDYPTAIRLLTAILEQPENSASAEALELLGLARERNDQFSHAYAEYSRYLELYPEGEDAARVQQRLAGLITAAQKKPKQALRKPRREQPDRPWEVFGNISQSYRRNGVQGDIIEDATSLSEIDTNLYISARRRTSNYDIRLQLTGGYAYDMLKDGPGDSSTVSDAYFELENRSNNLSGKLGRQRARSSGILNRFDGAYLGYQVNEDLRVNVALGLPVESSKDSVGASDKIFFGVSAHMASLFKNVDASLFAIEQQVDDLVDRRAIGGEVRYFNNGRSIFGLIDYDVFHSKLNTLMVQSNWSLPDQSQIYANFDYRASPSIATSNAIQGQSVDKISDLRQLFSDSEIFQLADDRTADSTVISIGANKPLTSELQISGDFTVSNTSGTPASGGVDATTETGNEYFYSAQVLKNNLLKKGDVGILSLRYSDASSSDTYTLTANSRYPISNLWRVNAKLSAAYRENKSDDDSRVSLGGRLQADYRLRKDVLLEFELGATQHKESGANPSTLVDYFFMSGYRWEL